MLVEMLPEQLGGEVGRSGTRRRPPSIDTVEGKDWRGVLRVWGGGDGKSEGWIVGFRCSCSSVRATDAW